MKTRTWIVIDCKESVNNIMIRMKCAFVLKGYKTHNMDAICKTNIKKCITYSVITQNFLSVKFTRYERGMIKISIIFYIFSLYLNLGCIHVKCITDTVHMLIIDSVLYIDRYLSNNPSKRITKNINIVKNYQQDNIKIFLNCFKFG